jgi:hypothetical protein
MAPIGAGAATIRAAKASGPVVRDAAADTGTGTSLTVTSPATTKAGDLLLFYALHTRTDAALALQGGYTQEIQADTTPGQQGFMYRVARRTASADGAVAYTPYTAGLSNVWGLILVVIEAGTFNAVTPVNVKNSVGPSAGDAGLDPPQVTTTVANCLVLASQGQELASALNTVITPGAGYTKIIENVPSSAREVDGAIASKLRAVAGAENPPAFTDTQVAEYTAATTIAIRPA